jgi:hypothetical protein
MKAIRLFARSPACSRTVHGSELGGKKEQDPVFRLTVTELGAFVRP